MKERQLSALNSSRDQAPVADAYLSNKNESQLLQAPEKKKTSTPMESKYQSLIWEIALQHFACGL